MTDRRSDHELRKALDDCHMGARWMFRTLLEEYPEGWIDLDEWQMADHFNVSIRVIRHCIANLRHHALLRRGVEGYYIPAIIAGAWHHSQKKCGFEHGGPKCP
jgi:hypothetical protein